MRMTPLDAMKLLAAGQYSDEDAEPFLVELREPADAITLDAPQPSCGRRWPKELADLLRYATGFTAGAWNVDFMGHSGVACEEYIPAPAVLMGDGLGNSWVADVDPMTGAWGRVYFICHDPPVVVLQSLDLASFLTDIKRELESTDSTGPLSEVHDRHAMRVWRQGIELPPVRHAPHALREALTGVFGVLSPECRYADLGAAVQGDGFAWGVFGPGARVRRLGRRHVFIIEPE